MNHNHSIPGIDRGQRQAGFLLVLAILGALLLQGCNAGDAASTEPPVPSAEPTRAIPSLTFQVGECDQDGVLDLTEKVTIAFSSGGAQIEQDARYVCCAEFDISLEQEGDTLKVIETNTGEVCRCFCAYRISAQINDIPADVRRVQVWGIYYPDMHPLELLGEAEIP